MSITKKGAWFYGGYKPVMVGTDGQSLDSDTDNLGWACFAWKYELYFNGYQGAMVLDQPTLGDAAGTQIAKFQADNGITVSRTIGSTTGERLCRKRIRDNEKAYSLPAGTAWQLIAQESSFDLGAIGYVDTGDRGLTQRHLDPNSDVLLSQAIRPAWAVPRLCAHLQRVSGLCDLDTAIVSWNIGEGSAEWWFDHGKPTTGSPSWWSSSWGDMSQRAWAYLTNVQSHNCPYA